jgi:hypothetical protein
LFSVDSFGGDVRPPEPNDGMPSAGCGGELPAETEEVRRVASVTERLPPGVVPAVSTASVSGATWTGVRRPAELTRVGGGLRTSPLDSTDGSVGVSSV